MMSIARCYNPTHKIFTLPPSFLNFSGHDGFGTASFIRLECIVAVQRSWTQDGAQAKQELSQREAEWHATRHRNKILAEDEWSNPSLAAVSIINGYLDVVVN
jgi:hypothetical protein